MPYLIPNIIFHRYEDRRKKKSTQEGVDILSICLTNGGRYGEKSFDCFSIRHFKTSIDHMAINISYNFRIIPPKLFSKTYSTGVPHRTPVLLLK